MSALLILVYFIFAVLSVFLFYKVVEGDTINNYMNFSNFGMAIIMLFRCSTGEDWHIAMFDCVRPRRCIDGTSNCGSAYAYLFFIAFNVICQLVMLNLFVMVII